MDIIISSSSGKPIYEQISSQIKAMILSGQLREGDSLPSMRLLAKELRISLITTKRAYNDLQQEGFIQTITGKGSFVAVSAGGKPGHRPGTSAARRGNRPSERHLL